VKKSPDVHVAPWTGAQRPYDIIKEGTIALIIVALLTVGLAIVFGSPDDPQITVKTWSTRAPIDFAQTALTELNGTSGTAQYGAPYNTASTGQALGPFTLAKWMGATIPVNTVRDFVLAPLESQPPTPALSAALAQWKGASAAQRTAWVNAYTKVAPKMRFANGAVVTPTSASGPVPEMISALEQMARSGALDQALVTQSGFYTSNFTLPLLFLADGSYLGDLAQHRHLLGTQWGMMNETGNYPGQAWLWLYTFWYQVPPFSTSGNADVLVWGTMMLLTLVLALVPFIPGLRSIPRWTRVYRIIWRDHYRTLRA
jgi:hypothetical protein